VRSICIVVDLPVVANNIQLPSVAIYKQDWVPFALYSCRTFRIFVNNTKETTSQFKVLHIVRV